jgi:2-hydroxychromene-2-carboxylate isomerase
VRLPQELSPQDRGLQLVEGRVRRAGETRAFAYLDFSAEWRDEASVQIPSRALADFRAAGLDPLRLEGRLIRVRGDVQGLRLTVDHPEAIERLRDG